MLELGGERLGLVEESLGVVVPAEVARCCAPRPGSPRRRCAGGRAGLRLPWCCLPHHPGQLALEASGDLRRRRRAGGQLGRHSSWAARVSSALGRNPEPFVHVGELQVGLHPVEEHARTGEGRPGLGKLSGRRETALHRGLHRAVASDHRCRRQAPGSDRELFRLLPQPLRRLASPSACRWSAYIDSCCTSGCAKPADVEAARASPPRKRRHRRRGAGPARGSVHTPRPVAVSPVHHCEQGRVGLLLQRGQPLQLCEPILGFLHRPEHAPLSRGRSAAAPDCH